MKRRFEEFFKRYGPTALWTYIVIFLVVFVGFTLAITLGFQVEGAAGNATMLGAAWLATKLTQPLRIGATVLLTPLVARLVARLRQRDPAGSNR